MQVTATQIKAQMEEQLKQQRLALQQKRLQEAQAKLSNTSSTAITTSASTITLPKPLTIIGSVNSTHKPGLATIVSQASTTPVAQPYKGIRRIFTTKGCEYDDDVIAVVIVWFGFVFLVSCYFYFPEDVFRSAVLLVNMFEALSGCS